MTIWRQAIEDALCKTKVNITRFGSLFPNVSERDKYVVIENVSWTGGFWSGMLWLAFQYSGDEVFREAARQTVDSFRRRLDERLHLEHHDVGFLYSLSSKAQWIIEGDMQARQLTLAAAEVLTKRWRPKAGLIQAWGAEGHERNGGRIIIDSLMNMPLLHWAYEQTGEARYRDMAVSHTDLSLRYLVRGDASSYHTFRFDEGSGEPVRGETHQGYSDGSTWTRGQAWGIYGFALAYQYTGHPRYLEAAKRMAQYWMERLPENHVVYWDFNVDITQDTKRDSSAAVIAACGMLELLRHLPANDPVRALLTATVDAMMTSVVRHDSTMHEPAAEGLIKHGSYSVRNGRNTDDYMIWGDYFYLEALLRLEKGYTGYWYKI